MAFTLSGRIITQTVSTTDSDLSALATLINGIATVARSTASIATTAGTTTVTITLTKTLTYSSGALVGISYS